MARERNYDREIAWQKNRYRRRNALLVREYDERLQEVLDARGLTFTAWVRACIDLDHADLVTKGAIQ